MPIRITPLATGEIYHILNRGTASIPVFRQKRDYMRFIHLIDYYRFSEAPGRFSRFLQLSRQERQKIINSLKKKGLKLVTIIAYCLMPNHFHLLLRQEEEKGITEFMRLIQNSYSRYFNLKYQRRGSLFENRFKAIRVETEEQLLHLSRYIHLNPYSSYLVRDKKQLLNYPFSSLKEYLKTTTEPELCSKDVVISCFGSKRSYRSFVLDQADYQRSLEIIKHQLNE